MFDISTQEYVIALYNTLRQMHDRDFKPEDYFWMVGLNHFRELQPFFSFQQMSKPLMLMGIRVEINRFNPDELKLYEDITNKVAVPYVEVEEIKS